jgi:type I restriction enzyme S subunit
MGLKPGYKHTEVGGVPQEWTVRKLAELASFRTGPFGSTLHKSDYTEDGIPVINPMHIIDGQLAPTRTMTITEDAAGQLTVFRLREGDVIIGRRGDMGRCAVVKKYQEGWLCGTGSLIIRCGDYVYPEFLQRVLSSPLAVSAIKDASVGSTMINLNQSVLGELSVQCPPMTEQRAIAGALSDVDALIGALDKLIAKKRDIKQAAMQQLLTGKQRLPGFNGKWQVLNMAERSVLKARIGWQGLTTAEYQQNGDFYLVTGTDFVNGRVNWSSCCFVDAVRYVQDRNIQLKPADVLLTKDGTIGKVGFVDSLPRPATLNSGVFVIRPKNAYYDSLFFYFVLTSHIFDDFLAKLQAGSTISHLYQKDFVNFSFLAPAFDEQRAISSVLSDMDAEIAALEQRRDKTRALKQGMMQEILTGKTRLTSVVAKGVEKEATTSAPENVTIHRTSHNWQFNEAVIIAALAHQFGNERYPLGRLRYTKLSYLLHRHFEAQPEGYQKMAAGPYNPRTRYGGPEKIAQNRKYAKACSREDRTGFIAGENNGEALSYFEKWYGPGACQWLDQFRYVKNETLELWTTVDMAMRELIADGKETTTELVKSVIRSNPEWIPKLNRPVFSDERIGSAIQRLVALFAVRDERR